MTNTYSAFSFFNLTLHGFAMAAVIVIVWLGWLRTREPGYLVLAGWALASMAGMALYYVPTVQAFFGGPRNSNSTMQFMMWSNLIRTIVTSVLLLAGLGLLVFGRRSGTKAE